MTHPIHDNSNSPRGRSKPAWLRRINLFAVSLSLCAVISIVGVFRPDTIATVAEAVRTIAFESFDWLFLASMSVFLILSLVLGFGRYGKLRLGGPHERPEFSTWSWLAMLFAAGMGIGVVLWGVAEPLTHFDAPPNMLGGSAAAARRSMQITMFHWGIHAWGLYAFAGLVLAYFGLRHGAPYLAGTPIRVAFTGRWVEPVARCSDLVAVLGVALGVAASMSTGVLQLHTGTNLLFGWPMESQAVPVGIILVLTICYLTSATTGVDKGIKWLSNFNMGLAIVLMVIIAVAGPTAHIFRTLFTTMGDYASGVVGLSLELFPFGEGREWLHTWTLTSFLWWIAWAPFVGVFIARISRGRTIREFVVGVIFAPTAFALLWFSTFGGSALHEELQGPGGLSELVRDDATLALFSLFGRYPATPVLSAIALLLSFIFLATSLDSSTFVLGMLTQRGEANPTTSRKLAWGVVLSLMATALVFSGSIHAIRAVAVTGAVPFTFILFLHAVAIAKVLRREHRSGRNAP